MKEKQQREAARPCDVCGTEVEESFFDFDEAVDYKKTNGWKSKRYGGDWVDVCPDCIADEAVKEFK